MKTFTHEKACSTDWRPEPDASGNLEHDRAGATPGPDDALEILGVRIARKTSDESCALALARSAERSCFKIYIPNAHSLNLACRDAAYRLTLNNGDLVLRDGIGLQIAAWTQGSRFPDNLVGTDYVPKLCAELGKRNGSVYMLGGRPGVPERAGKKLVDNCPGLTLAGCQHGYFDKENCAEVLDAINAASPSLLLVAFGNPLQETWIERNAPTLKVGVAIGVGGLFDHLAGELIRAPLWMRKVGLEWLFILLCQPYKWKRYLLGNPAFLCRIAAECCMRRLHRIIGHKTENPAGE